MRGLFWGIDRASVGAQSKTYDSFSACDDLGDSRSRPYILDPNIRLALVYSRHCRTYVMDKPSPSSAKLGAPITVVWC